MPLIGIFASAVNPVVNYRYYFATDTSGVIGSSDGVTFSWLSGPTRDNLSVSNVTRVDYLNSKYFATSESYGVYATSTDGITWTYPNTILNGYTRMIYENGKYTALYANESVGNSTDEINWTFSGFQVNVARGSALDIAYGNSTYVIVGVSGTLYTSTDAVTWVDRYGAAGGLPTEPNFRSVAFGNGVFVAVGYGTFSPNFNVAIAYSSTDGITWTSRYQDASGDTQVQCVTYVNGYFVTPIRAGIVIYSTDGTTWTKVTTASGGNDKVAATSSYYHRVAYGDGKWAFGDTSGIVFTSTNMTSWAYTSNVLGNSNDVATLIHDGSKFVIGSDNTGNIDTVNNIWTSTNMTTFTSRARIVQVRPTMRGLATNGSTYVTAGSSGFVATSSDVLTWTSRTSGFGTSGINSITYGNSTFVIAGVSGLISSSTDGITWTSRTSQFGTSAIQKVKYVNNLFLAVGNSGKLSTSTDGTTWTTRTSQFSTTTINGITYGNGVYVITGVSGKVSTSTNGTTWVSRTSNLTSTIRGAAYGNSTFVISASTTQGATSTDGTTWTSRTFPAQSTVYVINWSSTDNLFLMDGLTEYGSQWYYHVSTDGITWTSRSSDKIPSYNITYDILEV